MSIRFKFKSDHEYEDLELAGASSISCGDLKQAILDKRTNDKGVIEFRVKWKYTGEEEGEEGRALVERGLLVHLLASLLLACSSCLFLRTLLRRHFRTLQGMVVVSGL